MPESGDQRLYGRRRRSEEIARREAEGENLWTSEIDSRARVRLEHIARSYVDESVSERVKTRLREEEGLTVPYHFVSSELGALDTELEDRLSIIEAIYASMAELNQRPDRFAQEVNQVLSEHRIAFELVEGRVVPFESREMHTAVVVPTLTLLAREAWSEVENDYQKALTEIGRDPSDAITDAARSLEAALDRLGCEGKSLGPRIDAARERGLLGRHDSKLTDGISKIMDWVSADRSERGDAHRGGEPTREDAWMTVHIVGALILRLAS